MTTRKHIVQVHPVDANGVFKIRRYWLSTATPWKVLKTLNYYWGKPPGHGGFGTPYMDINYWGKGDSILTFMELKYSEWIDSREDTEAVYLGRVNDATGELE